MASKRGRRNRKRQAQCVGKIRHASKEDAVKHVAGLWHHDKEPMTSYRCRFCGGYHVGHH